MPVHKMIKTGMKIYSWTGFFSFTEEVIQANKNEVGVRELYLIQDHKISIKARITIHISSLDVRNEMWQCIGLVEKTGVKNKGS